MGQINKQWTIVPEIICGGIGWQRPLLAGIIICAGKSVVDLRALNKCRKSAAKCLSRRFFVNRQADIY